MPPRNGACLLTSNNRQRNVYRGAPSGLGFEADCAAVLVDDLAGIKEAPVRTGHSSVGDFKGGIEDGVRFFRGHALAVVADRDLDLVAKPTRLDGDTAVAIDGLERVA